jgi:hypothetical protein
MSVKHNKFSLLQTPICRKSSFVACPSVRSKYHDQDQKPGQRLTKDKLQQLASCSSQRAIPEQTLHKSHAFQLRLDSKMLKQPLAEFLKHHCLTVSDFKNYLNSDHEYLKIKALRANASPRLLCKVKAQDSSGRILKFSSYHCVFEEERPTEIALVVQGVSVRSEIQIHPSDTVPASDPTTLCYWCIFEIEHDGFTDVPSLPWRSAFSPRSAQFSGFPVEVGHAQGWFSSSVLCDEP